MESKKQPSKSRRPLAPLLRKPTLDLLRDLKNFQSYSSYEEVHTDTLGEPEFACHLSRLLDADPRSRVQISKDAGISEIYLYQVSHGKRVPTRDRLLCLCIALQLQPEEANLLLQECGYASLYPRYHRDAIVLHALYHKRSLAEVDSLIVEYGEGHIYGPESPS